MEGYNTYSTHTDSGDSSPQCETAGSWDDTPQPTPARVKIMCSYNGRIQPRPHDNQLSYFGGETKILAVDRSIRFQSIVSKLSSLHGTNSPAHLRFKYQLPGEDLDALISVTNDDDLEHMMIEYDRLHLSSAKPAARLRLFLFSKNSSVPPSPAPLPAVVPDFLSGVVDSDSTKEETRINAGEIRSEKARVPATQVSEGYWPGIDTSEGYWPGIDGGRITPVSGGERPVYLIPAYYAGAAHPAAAFPRVLAEGYRDLPGMYAVGPTQGMEGLHGSSAAAGYAAAAASQMGYDGMGRAVFYPGPVAAYQAINVEGKMNKNPQIL